jgi:hypothetical protein
MHSKDKNIVHCSCQNNAVSLPSNPAVTNAQLKKGGAVTLCTAVFAGLKPLVELLQNPARQVGIVRPQRRSSSCWAACL